MWWGAVVPRQRVPKHAVQVQAKATPKPTATQKPTPTPLPYPRTGNAVFELALSQSADSNYSGLDVGGPSASQPTSAEYLILSRQCATEPRNKLSITLRRLGTFRVGDVFRIGAVGSDLPAPSARASLAEMIGDGGRGRVKAWTCADGGTVKVEAVSSNTLTVRVTNLVLTPYRLGKGILTYNGILTVNIAL